MATEFGSTPKRRLLPGTSSGISPVVRRAGGAGTSCSFQSGSAGINWADAVQAAPANVASATNLRSMLSLDHFFHLALRIRVEHGAGRQLHRGRGQLHAVVGCMVAVARAHAAAQVAVAVVVAGQVAR